MDAEKFHICVDNGMGSQEVIFRVKVQCCIYGQVREDVDCGPNLVKAGGLTVCTGNGTSGDASLDSK